MLLAASLLWGASILLSGVASRLPCAWCLLADTYTHLARCLLGLCSAVWTPPVGRLLSVLQYNAHSGCHCHSLHSAPPSKQLLSSDALPKCGSWLRVPPLVRASHRKLST